MNDREELIQELMKNPIGKDETFYFKCRQCGECCKNRVDVLLSPFEQWFSVWQGIVMEISERIRTVLPKMPGRSGDELLMGIAQILYLRYKLEQPLIPQVKEKAILVGKMITMVEGTLANATGQM